MPPSTGECAPSGTIVSFESGSAKSLGGDKISLKGSIEMLGVKKPVTFEVEKIGEGKGARGGEVSGFEARATIQRSDFGMNYGLANGALGDDVELIISVEGAKQ